MVHICALPPLEEVQGTLCQKLKKKIQSIILVSPSNPLRFAYFKSLHAVKEEQERQLRTNRFVVHPFSTFRGMYEVYLVLLYGSILILKPLTPLFELEVSTLAAAISSFLLNAMCWMDIVMTFFCGYVIYRKELDIIELRFSRIARHYVLGPYFVCDVISSIPRMVFYYLDFIHSKKDAFTLNVVINTLIFFKLVRIVPLFSYIYRSVQFLRLKAKTAPFLICVIFTTIIIIHWAACLQFAVSVLGAQFSDERKKVSWVYRNNIHKKTIPMQYVHCFYKATAYILSIRELLYGVDLPEEYFVAYLTYIIGKVLVAFIWLILAMAILNYRSIDIKYMELKNQLEEYMWRKRIPFDLKQRISEYYNFKFQRKYFNEKLVNNVLPENIKNEVTMHMCKVMIGEVSIFSHLDEHDIKNIVEYLILEIFMPQDVIIQHGTYGDAMYFLFSGTVAVYTRSGREICHLQEGSYFGEISLLLPEKSRITSVVAIETSQVYKLKRKDFECYILKNKLVLSKIMMAAEERLIETIKVEEMYKNLLLEQALQNPMF